MKHSSPSTLLLLGLVVGCQSARERSTDLPPLQEVAYERLTTPQLLRLWLLRDCDLPADRRLEAVLVARRDEVVPRLREALSSGPPEDLLAEEARKARERIRAARRLLDDPERTGLAPEDLERARDQDVEAAVRRALEELEKGWAEQALRGLATLLGLGADPLIEAAAADPEHPAHDAARLLQRDR